jgi:hypothetical protein
VSFSAATCSTPSQIQGTWCDATMFVAPFSTTHQPAASGGSYTGSVSHGVRLPACDMDLEPGLTSGKVQDYMALWSAFLVAAVAVLAAKALYNRFRLDHGGA